MQRKWCKASHPKVIPWYSDFRKHLPPSENTPLRRAGWFGSQAAGQSPACNSIFFFFFLWRREVICGYVSALLENHSWLMLNFSLGKWLPPGGCDSWLCIQPIACLSLTAQSVLCSLPPHPAPLTRRRASSRGLRLLCVVLTQWKDGFRRSCGFISCVRLAKNPKEAFVKWGQNLGGQLDQPLIDLFWFFVHFEQMATGWGIVSHVLVHPDNPNRKEVKNINPAQKSFQHPSNPGENDTTALS